MKNIKEIKGITLISLVITIIILLILATVAITLAVDSNGLFNKAGDAANRWNTSAAEEESLLNDILNYNSSVNIYVTDEENGRTAPIPKGYVASKIPGEDTIADGLVIYEGTEEVTGTKGSAEHEEAMTTRNQYVWIPVDDITDMVMCQVCGDAGKSNLNKTTLECATCKDAGKQTKLAGKLYATTTENSFTANLTGQTYINDDDENFSSAESQLREPDDLNDATDGDASSEGITAIKAILGEEYKDATTYAEVKDKWNEQLYTDFENMAKSVAKHKGFYIGRYEAGTAGSSKKGQTVLRNTDSTSWWMIYNELRSNPQIDASTYSQMIWGSQYDQVMKFIAEKERKDGTGTTTFDIKTSVSARHNAGASRASGSNISDLVCNIYDLEGNYYEWTTEADYIALRVLRGRFLLC